MRTKELAKKARPNLNGNRTSTPSTTTNAPAVAKSPAPPFELSEKDRVKVREWLDGNPTPFRVLTGNPTKKRKLNSSNPWPVQDDLFEDRLTAAYHVQPADKWESLRKYKKFTVGSDSIATGQCILVKHEGGDEQKIDLASQWKAKVLEVRALDTEHVYIRVAWLNRPEDLKTGREKFHGKNELIPTNQMDVIDAMAVNGSLEVVHWDDSDDDSATIEDQYFWRYTFDFANGAGAGELRTICIDGEPANPDEMIIQCSDEKCRKWMHVKCIAEKAVTEHESANKKSATPKRGRPKNLKIGADSTAVGKASNKGGTIEAEVFVKGHSAEGSTAVADSSKVVVTDASGEHSRDILCLHCKSPIVDD